MRILSWGANSHGQLGQGNTSEQCETPREARPTWRGDVVDIVAGGGHSILINAEATLFGCGWNHHRQLALSGTEEAEPGPGPELADTFRRIWDMSGIRIHEVAAGWDSSAAITDQRVLYVWGGNSYGQLGLPRRHFKDSAKPIRLELRVASVRMGMRHTVLADVNGRLWATGAGKKGQLGMGEAVIDSTTFQRIPDIENIEQVACGQHHTLARSARDGALYCWGNNLFGELGLEKTVSRVFRPIRVPLPRDILDNVKSIHCGWTHSALLLTDGTAVYWGRGDYGQRACRAPPDDPFYNTVRIEGEKIVQLSLGSEHSVCLTDAGSVWSWGWNEHGNTGTGGSDPTSVLENVFEPRKVEMEIGKVIKVAAGSGHNFAILG